MLGRLVRLLLFLVVLAVFVLFAARLLQKKQSRSRDFAGAAHHLTVRLDSGSVTINGRAGDNTSLRRSLKYSFRKPTVSERTTDSGVEVKGECPGFDFGSCSISYTVDVPLDESVDVETKAGSVRVRAVSQVVRVKTAAGSISVDDLEGNVTLSTSAGSIKGTNIKSTNVTASTSAGSVDLVFTAAPQLVDASTSAGSVVVDVPDDTYRVETHTSAGSTRTDVKTDADATRTIKASTSAGSIHIKRHTGLR